MSDIDAKQPAASEADRTLVIVRQLPGTPERAFRAWTDPQTLARWWGPEGHHTPEYKLDARTGGSYRTTMMSPTGEKHIVSGTYHEVSPPRRLVMSWAWEDNGIRGHETEIEVTFEPNAGGTRLRLVQRIFRTSKDRDNHNLGWTSSLNDLEKLLAAG